MSLHIAHHIRISASGIRKDGSSLCPAESREAGPEEWYRRFGMAYPRFFKMDDLCKWAWAGAECLLKGESGFISEGVAGERTAIVLFTKSGCLQADRRYAETLSSVPSPALFVYTLSNIMLGEIAIRHGFKGEQLCMVQDRFDSGELQFWVEDLLLNKGMEACLCGWVDITGGKPDLCLFWVSRDGNGEKFSRAAMDACYGI